MTPPLPLLHRPLLRWATLFVVWTLVGLVFVLQYYIFTLTAKVPFNSERAVWIALGWYPWIVLTPVVAYLARRWPIDRANAVRRVAWHLGLASLLCVAEVAFFEGVHAAVREAVGDYTFAQSFRLTLIRSFFVDLLVYSVILSAVHAIDYYQKYRERDLRTAHLETQLVHAQLQALRMQLNPHFLFNTLHAISSLMDEDVRDARRMMTSLSELLRYSLDREDEGEVPLEEELSFLKRYLQIEQVRFQDRLTVEMEIAPDVLDALVPALILQPLVENAIKHGIAPYAKAGRIVITARRTADGALSLRVSDNGHGLQAPVEAGVREGIGLKNTRERLAQYYGPAHHFDLGPGPEGGLTVALEIPYRTDVYELAT